MSLSSFFGTQLKSLKYCYLTLIILFNICLYIVKWFHILLCITNNSIQQICLHTVKWSNSFISNHSIYHKSFIYTQFKCQSSIWPIDRTLSGATTPGQSGLRSNGNEGIPQIPQISKAGASLLDGLMSYLGHSLGGRRSLTPLQRCSWCILQPHLTVLQFDWF